MGKVIGTCGHELRGVDDNVLCIKEYDGSDRVVCQVVVCDECAKYFRKKRLVLKDEEAENRWLRMV